MKNTIRCCISCILPCGALDVIRVIHSDGRVEEFSRIIQAGEVMKANPKHVLRKPSSSSETDHNGVTPKTVILPPDAELQRGKIYFLMPVSLLPEKNQSGSSARQRRREKDNNGSSISVTKKILLSDQYLSEILSEKISTQRDRKRGRVGVWRPHLDSISENPSDL